MQENLPELKDRSLQTERDIKRPAQWAPSTKVHNHREISKHYTLKGDPTHPQVKIKKVYKQRKK